MPGIIEDRNPLHDPLALMTIVVVIVMIVMVWYSTSHIDWSKLCIPVCNCSGG
jgi:hypothetical protein